MKTPLPPPRPYSALLTDLSAGSRLAEILGSPSLAADPGYHPWEWFFRHEPPAGLSHEEWWLAVRAQRTRSARTTPFTMSDGTPLTYNLPDPLLSLVDDVSLRARGQLAPPEPIVDPASRDRYLVSSLIEEAITSSQLEGASTSRVRAKRMLREGRAPRDRSEQMILNSFRTMQRVRDLRDQPLTPELVCEIHRGVTADTLDDPAEAGRVQRPGEARVRVYGTEDESQLLHLPPPAEELPERLERLCAFANAASTASTSVTDHTSSTGSSTSPTADPAAYASPTSADPASSTATRATSTAGAAVGSNDPGPTTPAPAQDAYLPPVLRALTLHFMMGYDHYFVDGNGRTSRAVFYWSMLNQGLHLTEYLSVSRLLRQAPAQYARSFLHTEVDEGDLTYFFLHQARVISRAFDDLDGYLRRKTEELSSASRLLRGLGLNHRQVNLLESFLKDPGASASVASHQRVHGVATRTARTDLQDLEARGLLSSVRQGRRVVWFPQADLADRVGA